MGQELPFSGDPFGKGGDQPDFCQAIHQGDRFEGDEDPEFLVVMQIFRGLQDTITGGLSSADVGPHINSYLPSGRHLASLGSGTLASFDAGQNWFTNPSTASPPGRARPSNR